VRKEKPRDKKIWKKHAFRKEGLNFWVMAKSSRKGIVLIFLIRDNDEETNQPNLSARASPELEDARKRLAGLKE
jgi:hypothetical protein